LKSSFFNRLKVRKAFFKAVDRSLISIPSVLSFEHSGDELYAQKQKLVLKFFLGRGSYATMFIKSLLV
ncbi:MAG: tRNA pseudouridine(13) synthase TruD, partial [Candidatus Omnitrophica bacterium]|nr:tRNA pseudouridine(13) synthase TruD [Candidatus Omnitrophota bacterium]